MTLIVVDHSMGGLAVREAINKYKGQKGESKIKQFVSIASPFGSHSQAAKGENNGLIVLPAWRDLNPNNRFIQQLYRKPLPEFINHQLFYAFRNPGTLKLGENNDGVVPLSSQLHPEAQKQAKQIFAFDSGHVNILSDEQMIARLFDLIVDVDSIFSKQSMAALLYGGFEVKLSDDYRATTKHLIHYAGKYLVLLVHDRIAPLPQQNILLRRFKARCLLALNWKRNLCCLCNNTLI